jgi:hypothetical protein
MPRVSYKIVKSGDEWAIARNGQSEKSYLTQEAAFEIAAADASADLRSGFDVVIEAAAPTLPAGASDQGGAPVKGDGFS